MSGTNPLAMSDEEFLKSGAPPVVVEETVEKQDVSQEEQPGETETEVEQEPAKEEPEGSTEAEDTTTGTEVDPDAEAADKPSDEPVSDAAAADKKGEPDKVSKPEDGKKDNKEVQPDAEKKAADAPVETPNYEEFYKAVMQPIKANGKTIELKSPEEAIRLMQMGAGFTKKLQDLQPVLKTVRMLEKADLLNEDKLSYLIDIHNKNPEAIKKLIKESGIDPLDLNPGDNVSYVPGNHAVSDTEMRFNEAISAIQVRDGGQETINTITQTWDQASINLIWENPDLLDVIQSQRESGIYPIIAAEIDRQRALGQIPPSTPFLHAYKQVGEHLAQTGALGEVAPKATQGAPQTASSPGQETQKQQQQVLATRTAAPKAQVKNSDKAKAAAPTASTPRKVAPTTNPLAMADDEFLKQFSGRL